MRRRKVIYTSAIIVLGIIQTAPLMAVLTSTIIGIVLGTIWMCVLGYFWNSTIIGRWYISELYRSTEYWERYLLGTNVDAE